MGRFLTGVLHVELLLAATLSGALIVPANSVEPLTLETAASSPPECGSPEIVVYEENERTSSEGPCAVPPRTAAELLEARAYLIATAVPGYTMTRQGPELAIGRLHPEFASRLASAIQEARSVGLAEAGIFSAYRPPAFGVGGFVDKFEVSSHLWACRRHAWDWSSRQSRSSPVARNCGQARCHLPLWP